MTALETHKDACHYKAPRNCTCKAVPENKPRNQQTCETTQHTAEGSGLKGEPNSKSTSSSIAAADRMRGANSRLPAGPLAACHFTTARLPMLRSTVYDVCPRQSGLYTRPPSLCGPCVRWGPACHRGERARERKVEGGLGMAIMILFK